MDAVAAVALLASAAGILYVLAGYPLWLGWLARRHARPVMKSDNVRPVSILLAVRNGAPWIRRKLDSILALDYPRDLLEIIVISDGSTDETEQIARSYDVRVLRVPQGGKALALNAGFNQATGDILVFTDVRQPLDESRRPVGAGLDLSFERANDELVAADAQRPSFAIYGFEKTRGNMDARSHDYTYDYSGRKDSRAHRRAQCEILVKARQFSSVQRGSQVLAMPSKS